MKDYKVSSYKEQSRGQMSHLTLHTDDVITDGSDGCLNQWWFRGFLSFTFGSGHQSDMRQEQLRWSGSAPQLTDVQWQQEQPSFWRRENEKLD